MSFIEQFSIRYKFKKDKLKKTIDNYSDKQSKINALFRTRTYTRKGNLSAQLAQKLVSLGYNIDSIMSLMKIHNFSNVEEALNLLEKNTVTNLYNHYFYPMKNDNSNLQRTKSEQIILRKNKDAQICRICGGTKEEHIDEKDEFNLELEKAKKNFEKSQYYGAENSNLNNNILIKEKNHMEMKIKAIERVRSMGNNLNKDNKALIFNLNNNIHKYYLNNTSNDYSQSHMIVHNPKAKSGTNINTLLLLNKSHINNISNNNLNTYDGNGSQNNSINNIEIGCNITNTEGSKNNIIMNKKQSSGLVTNPKLDLKQDMNNKISEKKIEKEEVNNKLISHEDENATVNSNDNNKIKLEENLGEKLKKFGIEESTLKQFKDPDICNICFENKVNKGNISQKCCQHYFCDKCIKKYMTYQINNGIVLEIKCLMAGCPHLYTSEEIRANVSNEVYRKYIRFYSIQIKIRNPEKVYINCPFIDCDELVDVTNIPDGNVICGVGHVFCKECLKLGGHSKKNSICKKNELNLDLYNELKQNNPSKIHQNYKQCPECKVLIEKNDGCNQMKCLNCGYSFCWLCLREYTYNHYSIYNVKGCPGMRFETMKTYKIRNNACLNFLWYMLSCLLYIFFFISIYIFYLFAGCPYEFVKCYLERKRNKGNDNKSNFDSMEIYDDNINEFGIGIGIGNSGLHNSVNQSNDINGGNGENNKNSKVIIWLLIFLGILCQPLYLSFYAIYTLIECYKRFNCMFYFPR
jgi:hypothetical protein